MNGVRYKAIVKVNSFQSLQLHKRSFEVCRIMKALAISWYIGFRQGVKINQYLASGHLKVHWSGLALGDFIRKPDSGFCWILLAVTCRATLYV